MNNGWDLVPEEADGLLIAGRDEPVIVSLAVLNETATFRMFHTGGAMRLGDIVPYARSITDILVEQSLRQLRQMGVTTACRAGCSACCRYMVPLSPPEAIRLAEDVARNPSRSMAIRRFKHACEAIELASMQRGRAVLREQSGWYQQLRLDCPLLQERLCALYDVRPLACRGFYEQASKTNCQPSTYRQETKLAPPVSMVQVLSAMSARLESRPPEAVLLPQLIRWIQRNVERAQTTWPARTMLQTFADTLADMGAGQTTRSVAEPVAVT